MPTFTTELLQAGKTATGVEVPPEVVDALGRGKRPPVKITINDHTWRSTVAVMGGTYMVGVPAEARAAAGVEGGQTVDVTLELDTEKRQVEVPPELAKALKKDATARAAFEQLSFSNQRRLAEPIAQAKSDDTRDRRLAKALEELRG